MRFEFYHSGLDGFQNFLSMALFPIVFISRIGRETKPLRK